LIFKNFAGPAFFPGGLICAPPAQGNQFYGGIKFAFKLLVIFYFADYSIALGQKMLQNR
jgi:hypothetical protein